LCRVQCHTVADLADPDDTARLMWVWPLLLDEESSIVSCSFVKVVEITGAQRRGTRSISPLSTRRVTRRTSRDARPR